MEQLFHKWIHKTFIHQEKLKNHKIQKELFRLILLIMHLKIILSLMQMN